MALIRASLDHANNRIRFFRIAFGAAEEGHVVRHGEITAALTDVARKARVDWHVPGDPPRARVKLAFLLIACCESAMPFGGTITVSETDGVWCVTGTTDRLQYSAEDWGWLTATSAEVSPAKVQFALVQSAAAAQRLTLTLDRSDTLIRVTF